MYSKNVYKAGWVVVQNDDKCVIDSNSRMTRRMEELEEIKRKGASAQGGEEFMGGLGAEKIDSSLYDEDDGSGNVIKGSNDGEPDGPTLEEVRAQIDEELEAARAEVEQIRRIARDEIDSERRHALDEARRTGYDEGLAMAQNEAAKLRKELDEERASLEAEYDELVAELEPQFIDVITSVYKHIFGTVLEDEKDILVYLIDSTLRKIDSSRTFIVHISRDDYEYVNTQKRALIENAVSGRGTVEVVEDITLRKNECMIETDGGIFDCGVGTQLEELTKKLKLLSYQV